MQIIYTQHVKERMFKRRISKEDVNLAIKQPTKIIKKNNKYYFQKILERGKIEVCTEKTWKNIKIITVYWI